MVAVNAAGVCALSNLRRRRRTRVDLGSPEGIGIAAANVDLCHASAHA